MCLRKPVGRDELARREDPQEVQKIFDEIAGFVEGVLVEAVCIGDMEGIEPAEDARALVA